MKSNIAINIKYKLICFFIVILFPLLIYFDSVGDYFISDDFSLILASRGNADFLSFFSPSNNPQWHYSPMLLIAFCLEFLLFGLKPFWWHLVTLMCHSANSCLVYYLAGRITGNNVTGLISAIIFASYYLHYEVVIWISGLHTTLMVLFYLISFLIFTKYLDEGKKLYYISALIFFTMTLLTKEESITLIIIFPLYDLMFSAESFEWKNLNKNLRKLKKYIPFILIALTFSITADRGTFKPHFLYDIFHFYYNSLLMLFIPNQFGIVKSLITVKNYPLIFSLLLGLIVFKFSSKSSRFFLLWVFITLLPSQIFSGVAARYLYLPSVGMAILSASAVLKISRMLSDKLLMENSYANDNPEIISQKRKNISLLFAVLILSFIVTPGILFINDRKEEWHNSSVTVKNIISAINLDSSEYLKGKSLFFILRRSETLTKRFTIGVNFYLFFMYYERSFNTIRLESMDKMAQ